VPLEERRGRPPSPGGASTPLAEEYENLVEASIIDPTKVVRSALQNASSIASLLPTTEALVSEIPEKKEVGVMRELGRQKYTRAICPEHPRALDYDRERGEIQNFYPGGGGSGARSTTSATRGPCSRRRSLSEPSIFRGAAIGFALPPATAGPRG
jgi:hypothetical protein